MTTLACTLKIRTSYSHLHKKQTESITNRKALFEDQFVRDNVQAAFSSPQSYWDIQMLNKQDITITQNNLCNFHKYKHNLLLSQKSFYAHILIHIQEIYIRFIYWLPSYICIIISVCMLKNFWV